MDEQKNQELPDTNKEGLKEGSDQKSGLSNQHKVIIAVVAVLVVIVCFCGCCGFFGVLGALVPSNDSSEVAENSNVDEKRVDKKKEKSPPQKQKPTTPTHRVKGITIENKCSDEITISRLSMSYYTISFTVKWHGATGRPGYNPWAWSAYDKDGVKLDGGRVSLPSSVVQGSSFKGQIIMSGDRVKNAGLSRIVIHPR